MLKIRGDLISHSNDKKKKKKQQRGDIHHDQKNIYLLFLWLNCPLLAGLLLGSLSGLAEHNRARVLLYAWDEERISRGMVGLARHGESLVQRGGYRRDGRSRERKEERRKNCTTPGQNSPRV